MFFDQIDILKNYVNDVSHKKNSDVNDNDVNSIKIFKSYVVIRQSRAIRRREKREKQKIKKLNIIKFIHIDIIINEHRIFALINFNNEVNLLSHQLVKQFSRKSNMQKKITLFIINDKRVNVYNVHFLNMKVNDTYNDTRYFHEFFLISNIIHEKVILKML